MDKLTAAQRRFGMNMYVSSSEINPGPAQPFIDIDKVPCSASEIKSRQERIDIKWPKSSYPTKGLFLDPASGESWTPSDAVDMSHAPHGPAHWNMALEIERKEAVIVELQRLLDEKDAEIDRLLEPTKWWRMLGWVIMTGTVLGVIAGVYEVIT